jgi:1,4-dihydroxy-2-naphthoyl-CoA synthase
MVPLPPLEAARYTVDQGIATITLDRPEKLNAYSAHMRRELEALFDETDADDQGWATDPGGSSREHANCATMTILD